MLMILGSIKYSLSLSKAELLREHLSSQSGIMCSVICRLQPSNNRKSRRKIRLQVAFETVFVGTHGPAKDFNTTVQLIGFVEKTLDTSPMTPERAHILGYFISTPAPVARISPITE
ncbi:hypothetical protein J6590_064786 [Homalodisca vitripennis]|nr:hypothetical protein J6590_064786 [Homalodisca vitripennis]